MSSSGNTESFAAEQGGLVGRAVTQFTRHRIVLPEDSRMALTPSTMLALGTPAPDFKLPDPDGNVVALSDFAASPALLVMFICNHCPYVKHVRSEIARLARDYQTRDVAVVAISSNDAGNYPADSPEKMAEEIVSAGYTFPYLFDETQEVAKAFRAACTPEFYLFDRARKLVYRGQLDGSRPGNDVPVTGKDLREALDALLESRPIVEAQLPGIGCNIKWKPGNEPDYFG
jgi:peroxiredoxin